MDKMPAVTVVTPTKHMGTAVVQACRALPMLIK